MSILVCSKDKKIHELVTATYESRYQIINCPDCDSCLDKFYSTLSEKNTDIKMCLLDIDGQENVIEIIEDFQLNHPRLRIIIIGRAISVDLAQEAVQHGADGYLIKPIGVETLKSIIK